MTIDTPFKETPLTGCPTTVVSRVRVIVDNTELLVYRGTGKFLPRTTPAPSFLIDDRRPKAPLI